MKHDLFLAYLDRMTPEHVALIDGDSANCSEILVLNASVQADHGLSRKVFGFWPSWSSGKQTVANETAMSKGRDMTAVRE